MSYQYIAINKLAKLKTIKLLKDFINILKLLNKF